MLILLFVFVGVHLYTICGHGLQPIKIVVDSEQNIHFNSSSQVLCFHARDDIDWPFYMLKDLHVVMSINISDAVYYNDVHPVSQLLTLDVRKIQGQSESVTEMDPSYICYPSLGIQSSSAFSFFSSFFYTSVPDTTQKLSAFDDVDFTFPTFPTSCIVVCRSSTQPATSQVLNVNVTSNFNELRIAQFAVGVLCLTYADYLSHTIGFYYVFGVGSAVFGSLVIVLIVLIRMLPLHRSGTVLQGILLLLGSAFSLSCMLLEYMRSTVFDLIAANAEYTMLYVIFVACFSFVLLYWFHLPDLLVQKYPRTTIVMKYALRVSGAALVIWSLYLPFDEVTFLNTFISYVSFQLDSNTSSTIVKSQIISSYAPKIVRFLLTLALVLFVDLLVYIRVSPTARSRSKRKPGFFSPGSPWASSSPYNGLSKIEYNHSRYHHRKSSNYADNLNSVPIRFRKSELPNHKNFSRHDTSYDLLTDDDDY